jgi:hypothetical protein
LLRFLESSRTASGASNFSLPANLILPVRLPTWAR